jgi:hypothetical protein
MNNLKNSFSVFFYAFRLNDGVDFQEYTTQNNSIWTPSESEPEKNYFFNHVQDFFTKNKAVARNPADNSCCVLFEIKKSELSELQKEKLFLLNHLFNRSIFLKGGKNADINFKLISDNSILAPRLFYHPLTNIAILSYTTALQGDSNTLDKLEELNYSMRLFGSSSDPVFQVEKNPHPKAEEQENKISHQLSEHLKKDFKPDPGFHSCTLDSYISLLLQDFPLNSYKSLSPRRLQAFVYAQLENKMTEEELQTASFRLRRIYNSNYTPNKAFLNNTRETYQSFEQIQIGASIEGAAIILNENFSALPDFLKQFDSAIRNRFLWTYLLAYFQRLTLIDINNLLSKLYDSGQPNKDVLIKALADLSKIELRSFFEQVSYFTQHNEFYDFVSENLKLSLMLKDVKEKLHDINRILGQQLAEAEKEKEKKKEKKDRILEIMVAALLIPETIFLFLSALYDAFDIHFPFRENKLVNYVLFGFSCLIFLLIIPFAVRIYKEYFKVARAYFSKKEHDDDIGFKTKFMD